MIRSVKITDNILLLKHDLHIYTTDLNCDVYFSLKKSVKFVVHDISSYAIFSLENWKIEELIKKHRIVTNKLPKDQNVVELFIIPDLIIPNELEHYYRILDEQDGRWSVGFLQNSEETKKVINALKKKYL